MEKINRLKSQIKSLNNRLKENKVKNICAFEKKLKQLKNSLKIEMELYAWENYLSK